MKLVPSFGIGNPHSESKFEIYNIIFIQRIFLYITEIHSKMYSKY